ncbi:TonB-dependent siderophore receptor, partial [Providencia rettgeri]|nr:TonB-dependent siderophore receptor [Providencia rettgeri]
MKNNLIENKTKHTDKNINIFSTWLYIVIGISCTITAHAQTNEQKNKDSILVTTTSNNNQQPNNFSSRIMQAGLIGDKDIMDIP